MENPLTVVESGCDEGIDETIEEKTQRRDIDIDNLNCVAATRRSYNRSY